jgi:hypothetical protein
MPNINTILSDLTKEDLEALQAKIVGDSLVGNRYLYETTAGGGVETRSKTIIGAVNEIFSQIDSIKESNKAFLEEFHTIVGNYQGTAEDQANYTALMNRIEGDVSNFFAGLIKLWDTVDSTDARSKILSKEVSILRDSLEGTLIASGKTYTYEDVLYSGSKFEISCKPLNRNAVSVYINGVQYGNDCFNYSNENKTIEWLCSDEGFPIACEFKTATEYNPVTKYYRELTSDSYDLVGTLTKAEFDKETYLVPDKEKCDMILVRYQSIDPNHQSSFRDLYNVTSLNALTRE